MTYLIDDPSEIGPRKYKVADMTRFGHDLAAALAFGEPELSCGLVFERDNAARLDMLNGKLSLHLYNETWSAAKASRIGVSVSLPDVRPGARPTSTGYGNAKYALPSITVSADRDMAAIAKDIRKRVIDASVAPAAEIRAYAAEQLAHRNTLAAHIAAMKATHGANIRFSEAGVYDCAFSWYQDRNYPTRPTFGNFYVDGRLNSDGTITIDRIRSIDMPAFDTIIQAMVK